MMNRNAENDSGLSEQIESNLRKVYQEKLQEPVPDKFLDLLEQLRRQDLSKGEA